MDSISNGGVHQRVRISKREKSSQSSGQFERLPLMRNDARCSRIAHVQPDVPSCDEEAGWNIPAGTQPDGFGVRWGEARVLRGSLSPTSPAQRVALSEGVDTSHSVPSWSLFSTPSFWSPDTPCLWWWPSSSLRSFPRVLVLPLVCSSSVRALAVV